MQPQNQQPLPPQPMYYAPPDKQVKSPFKLIIYLLGGVMVIFAILAVVLAGNNTSGDIDRLYAQQTEVARVADFALHAESASPASRNLASTIKLTASSAAGQLANIGADPNDKILAEFTDDTADSLLATAEQTNEFNTTYTSIMLTLVQNALVSLQNADRTGLDESETKILDDLVVDYQSLVAALDS